ncbi:rhodanese-like domain-containing protein [Pseudodesulfovibrio sp. JC047]|nr:rhodanese-like domain-containing protein [Pseudodesulfovibrio sp. JC047]
MWIQPSTIFFMLLAACVVWSVPVHADDNAVWWADAQAEAEQEGYALLATEELKALLESGANPLVIDARADYEFAAGHIPGAVNMAFDLGDRLELSQARRMEFEAVVGPIRDRLVVVYCRSFR